MSYPSHLDPHTMHSCIFSHWLQIYWKESNYHVHHLDIQSQIFKLWRKEQVNSLVDQVFTMPGRMPQWLWEPVHCSHIAGSDSVASSMLLYHSDKECISSLVSLRVPVRAHPNVLVRLIYTVLPRTVTTAVCYPACGSHRNGQYFPSSSPSPSSQDQQIPPVSYSLWSRLVSTRSTSVIDAQISGVCTVSFHTTDLKGSGRGIENIAINLDIDETAPACRASGGDRTISLYTLLSIICACPSIISSIESSSSSSLSSCS